MKRSFYLIIALFLLSGINAQNTISLAKAVEIALANNLDLQITENEAEQASNNNHSGNAGILPQVSLNISDNPSITNINQKFTNGTTIERNNVVSNSVSGGLVFTYTLFDGKKMFATKRKLDYLDQAAQNQVRIKMQELISSVLLSYSTILRMQSYDGVLSQLLDLSNQRLEIVQSRILAGIANNSDLYLAQLDLETNKQNKLNQELQIKNAFTNLNVLLKLKADSTYILENALQNRLNLRKSNLDSLLQNNPDWMLAEDQCRIAEQTQKEIAASRLPLVRLNGAYTYTLSQSQAGFSLYNQSMGPQAGLSLSIPLFSGNVNKSNLENAKLSSINSELRKEQLLLNLKAALERSWQEYSTTRLQLESDSVSVATAKVYMELMQTRFSLGQNTIIELREAQRTYETTYYRYISNLYILKLAETSLLGLTGQLTDRNSK